MSSPFHVVICGFLRLSPISLVFSGLHVLFEDFLYHVGPPAWIHILET